MCLGVVIYHLLSISMSQTPHAEADMCLGVVIYHLLSISMSQTPHAEADMCLGVVIYYQYQYLRHPMLKLICVLVKWSIINISVSDTPRWSWHVSWCSDLLSISMSQIPHAEADMCLGVVIYHLLSISMSQTPHAEADMFLGIVIYHLLSISMSQIPRAEADMCLGVVIYHQYQCLRYPVLKLICFLV